MLTERQESALKIAVRNGRWWPSGKGSNRIVDGLVQRGLAYKGWELLNGRPRHYLAPTPAGRDWLDGASVSSLEAARKRRGA